MTEWWFRISDNNNNQKNSKKMIDKQIIEGAYLSGYEPSEENLTDEQLVAEAQEYLFSRLTK